jgi:O-antigen/teichoic acid export membrane protein
MIVCNGAAGVSSLVFSVLLIPLMGYVGASLGTLLGSLLLLVMAIAMSRHVLPLTIPWRNVLRIVVATAPLFLGGGLALYRQHEWGFLTMLIELSFSSSLCVLIIWLTGELDDLPFVRKRGLPS